MRYVFLLSALLLACSISSPKAPSWELTGTLPLVAKTVFVREIAESEDEFFFGDYGPWRFMDSDSVLCSVVADSIAADWETLQDLPTDEPGIFQVGPTYWGENPLDEIEEPYFYRAWVEIVVRHTLPGSLTTEVSVEGWDDEQRPCGTLFVEASAEASASGEQIKTVTYAPEEEVLAFVNPSPEHAVPDSFSAMVRATYTPMGEPVGLEDSLTIKVSLLTALDLAFETTVVAKRAVVKQLIIAPEDNGDVCDSDVSADETNKFRDATFMARFANNLPVGGQGFLKIASDSLSLISDPELVIGPFGIDAAPFDPGTGKPTGVTISSSEAYIDSNDITILHNPGPGCKTVYSSMEYVLEGTGEQRVCVSAPDSVRLESAAIVRVPIEPEDN